VTTGTPAIASIVLAAGASRRMGRAKMLLPYGAGTVLSSAVAPHLQAGIGRVIVVLGDHAEEVRSAAKLPADARLTTVVNHDWKEGMASSIRRGLDECAAADAVLLALGDQPGVDAARVKALLSAWKPGVPLVVPVHGDRGSHPVLFARSLFDELRGLRGDVGGREVVRRHWAEAVRVPAPALADVDTEQDYRALIEGAPGRPGEGLKLP
jgi:molybdenum cofactor cytidylyltransferase